MPGLLEGFCPEPQAEGQLAVNVQGRLLLLRVADIHVLHAEAGRVALHVGKERYHLSESLDSVAAMLPPGLFLRVSASTLVNARQVLAVRRLCNGDWQVLLRNGLRLAPQPSLGPTSLR